MKTEVGHGYTYDDLRELAYRAAHHRNDDFPVAMSAIAERICDPEPIPEAHLVMIGRYAIAEDRRSWAHHYGIRKNHPHDKVASMPRFRKYWWDFLDDQGTEECIDDILDRLTLSVVWPRLPPSERAAFKALVDADGDPQVAARALGLTHHSYLAALSTGRARARRLWHDHEAPSRHYRTGHRKRAAA